MKNILVLAVATLLSACASSHLSGTEIKSETVSTGYSRATLNWQSGDGGVTSSVRVFEKDSKVAICGAVAELKGGERVDLTQQVIAKAQVLIGDERILQGIQFFKRHQPTRNLVGKASNCLLTQKAWEPAFKDERGRVRYKRGTYQTSS